MNSEELLSLNSVEVENRISDNKELFFTVSVQKLIVMSLFTFGFYISYWFYKNFKIIKERTGEKMIPIARGIFCVFFAHSLFKSIKATAIEKEIDTDFNGADDATYFILFLIVPNLIDRVLKSFPEYILFSVITLIIHFSALFWLCKAQKVINKIAGGESVISNKSISFVNILFILAGAIYWALTLYGIMVIAGKQFGF